MDQKSAVDEKSKQEQQLLFPPVDEKRAAEILGLGRQTLANWRHLRKGPVYHKISTRISYDVSDLIDFRERHRVHPEKTA